MPDHVRSRLMMNAATPSASFRSKRGMGTSKALSLTRARKELSAMQSGRSPETTERKTSILFGASCLKPSWMMMSASGSMASSSRRPGRLSIVFMSASRSGPTRTTPSAPACWNRQESFPGRSRSNPADACLITATRRPRPFRRGMTFSMSVVLPLFDFAATKEMTSTVSSIATIAFWLSGSGLRQITGLSGLRFSFPEEPRPEDAELVEQVDRDRHERHVEYIGRGCYERADHEGDEESVFAVFRQPGMVDDPHARKEDDHEGKLENKPGPEQELEREVDVLADPHDGRQVLGLVADKERDREGEEEKKAEQHSRGEEERGEEDELARVPSLPGHEAGGNEFPYLQEEHRDHQDKAGNEPDLEVGHEGFGERGEVELLLDLVGNDREIGEAAMETQSGVQGRHEEAEELLGKIEADREPRGNRDQGDDDPLSELFEVAPEGHPEIIAVRRFRFRAHVLPSSPLPCSRFPARSRRSCRVRREWGIRSAGSPACSRPRHPSRPSSRTPWTP